MWPFKKKIKVKKLSLPNRLEECDYDPNNSILRCYKCGETKGEWYNDQPGDRHLGKEVYCGGVFIRVWKANYNIE